MSREEEYVEEEYVDEYRIKIQGRRATIFSVLSALSLLICAAFASQIEGKLGVPKNLFYVLAGLGGALTLLLNLGADLNGISRKIYSFMAWFYVVDIVFLNLVVSVFVVADAQGINNQAMTSIAIFAVICLAAIFSLHRLRAVAGPALSVEPS